MKKSLIFGALASAMLFTTSCQEDFPVVQTGNEAVVSFNLSTPQIATRAYSDGLTATQLQYAVYKVNTNENGVETLQLLPALTKEGDESLTLENRKKEVNLKLTTGDTYTVVFWAQAPEGSPYTVNFKETTASVTANYKNVTCNNENLDAFFNDTTFTVTGSVAMEVDLRRPFAQLNIGTSDYTEAENSGYTVSQTGVTASAKVFNTFSLVGDHEVSDEIVDLQFAVSNIPANENFPIAGYKYLAMNYLLVDAEKAVIPQVTLTYNSTDGNTKTRTFGQIPVQRNYRTNIYGQLLTSNVDVYVEIIPDYYEPDNNIEAWTGAVDVAWYNDADAEYVITTGEQLAGFAKLVNEGNTFKGKTVKLGNDITLNVDFAFTPIGKSGAPFDGVFDGQGYKVYDLYVHNTSRAGLFGHAFSTAKIKNVTVENAVIESNHYAGAIVGYAYATIDNCHAKNVTITLVAEKVGDAYDNGDKAGGIIGYLGEGASYGVTNCTVNGAEIQAYRDLGGIVGYANANNNISGNKVTNTTLTIDATPERNYNNYVAMADYDAGYVVGQSASAKVENNTPADAAAAATDNVKIKMFPIESYDAFWAMISDATWYDANATELTIYDEADFAAFGIAVNGGDDFSGKTVKLAANINLYFEDITIHADGDPASFRPIGDPKYNGGKVFKGTFDGQGNTIENLYQNGWDLGYQWGVYGSYGLFGNLDNATVKNLIIKGSESYIEGGDVSFVAGSATGTCVFENITIADAVAATYNNGCGGIIGWSGAGNYTFRNITIGEDAVLAGLWGSFDSSIGGIVGQAEPGATYNFENVTINCRIDAYNDCTASYDYYNYRMCGMIIGRCAKTTTINGTNYPDLNQYNITCTNVTVNYGDWMNYHYCDPTPGLNGGRGQRWESGYSYDGLDVNTTYDHSQCTSMHKEWIPFNQLIGGDQYGVKGLPAVDGVTVNYPQSYYDELNAQQP